MKLITSLLVAAVCAFPQALPAPAAGSNVPADRVVVTVGNMKLTKAQFDNVLNSMTEPNRSAPGVKQTVLDNLGSILSLAQEARAANFDKDPKNAVQLMLRGEQELATGYMVDQMNRMSDDAFLKDWYSKNQTQFSQWKARHVLIRTQGSVVPVRKGMKELTDAEALAKAKAVRAKLAAGGDFAVIAKADSDDAGSAANGGDLGFFGAGDMVPPVEEAVSQLKPKEISEPVKTEFGYHVIQLVETRAKPFEDAKEEIVQKSRGELQQRIMEAAKRKFQVTADPEYFAK